MKQKIIQHIKNLIKEHIECQFCTNYKEALETLEYDFEGGTEQIYDCGRYDELYNLLTDIQNMEE
jgi:hypothetical protein